MQRLGRQRAYTTIATALACLVAAAPAFPAERRDARQLARSLGPGVVVGLQEETRRVGYIGTAPGRPIARPGSKGAGASPVELGAAFIDELRPELGLADEAELAHLRTTRPGGGRAAVRFQQLHDGLPVIGAELLVNLDRDGNVLSLTGEAEPDTDGGLPSEPRVGAGEAEELARAAVSQAQGIEVGALRASSSALSIYDSRILGGPGLGLPRLVWRFEITAAGQPEIRELVLIDAELGNVALSFNQVAHGKDRRVCDKANARSADYGCGDSFDRVEGGPATANPDVDSAYDYSGDTYDYFLSAVGRDSVDDAGLPLVSTVRWCPPLDPTLEPDDPEQACPYANAFWDGAQMVYGEGFAAADDIVGHELAHGLTESSSGLFYYYQSGAISESLSDIWGELIDLGNGAGSDGPADRWLVAEDAPIGAIRSMADPPAFGDPDRMGSPLYDLDADEDDNGGVHHNSGIGNKAAYLLVDGGSFNGVAVSPLGAEKVADIVYEAQTTLLTSAADYADLSNALNQACANLVGSSAISAADCNQVAAATDAVEMELTPPAAPTIAAPVCDVVGESAFDAFADDFDDPGVNNWNDLTRAGGPNAWAFSTSYATSGTRSMHGDDRAGNGAAGHDYAAVMGLGAVVPRGGYLRFDHAFGFDDDTANSYDGGVVEYSTDGGRSWADLGPMFAAERGGAGGYNGTIAPGFGVPAGMDGRAAFVGESNGYGASRADLSAFSKRRVRIGFRIGVDGSSERDDYGWYIDGLRIYGCAPETTITRDVRRDARAGVAKSTADATPTLVFTNSSALPRGFRCSADGGRFRRCRSGEPLRRLEDGSHRIRVRALGSRLTPDPSPASTSFKVTAAACKKAKKKLKQAKKKLKKAKRKGDRGKAPKAKRKLKRAQRKKRKNC